ncbi:3-deoxy-7-phosphoheptulonate synthase [Streptomyces sp. NBC_00459]|uniref:3-deoxy-7-phosphoheptulonate synthase n=1 Tax=Streptomyces sp. NBC_00459 TaxID=2975749 RepID=UPI002E196668
MSPEDAIALSRAALNPEDVPGRLTFIISFGAKDVHRLLPTAVDAVARHSSAQTGAGSTQVCVGTSGSLPNSNRKGRYEPEDAISHTTASQTDT